MVNREDLIKRLNGLSVNDLTSKFSKKEMACFYQILFGIEPRSNKTKLDLAYSLRDFLEDDKRTNDLCKNLY